MCYRLWIVSPLTLTEIRSMLPPAFSADIAPGPAQALLRPLLPRAQTVAALRIAGACACDLRLTRNGDDERHLRRRYAALGIPRDRVIAALDRHRSAPGQHGEPAARRSALAEFVTEHARNAGPTLYYLGFGAEPGAGLPPAPGEARTVAAAAVRAAPHGWLEDDRLTQVTR